MSVMSFSRADLVERQSAFNGLLAHPLVTPWTHSNLYRLIHRHEHTLGLWCARLGYRLVRIDQGFRLRRVPISGSVAAPRGLPGPRRPLVLALLVAAVLEDYRQDSITLQEISDALRHFAAAKETLIIGATRAWWRWCAGLLLTGRSWLSRFRLPAPGFGAFGLVWGRLVPGSCGRDRCGQPGLDGSGAGDHQ